MNTISYELDIDRTTLLLAAYAVILAYLAWSAAERAEREAHLAKHSARRVNDGVQQLRSELEEDVQEESEDPPCRKWADQREDDD